MTVIPVPTEPMELAERAAKFLEEWYGESRVSPQLASGVAVHFGEFSQFVPGQDADKLLLQIGRRIEELGCAYLAYRYAEEREREDQ